MTTTPGNTEQERQTADFCKATIHFGPDETHLEYTVWYLTADDVWKVVRGATAFQRYETWEALRDAVLAPLAPFVRQQWVLMEVSLPNRGSHGNLESGYIGSVRVLRVARRLAHTENGE